MKTTDFVVARRPSLGDIERFPAVEFGDYERRLQRSDPHHTAGADGAVDWMSGCEELIGSR